VFPPDGAIGEELRDARVNAGLSLDEISSRTKIRVRILESIEANDFSMCGGETYARGHVRQMAKVVGLDPDELISRVNRATLDGG
jgi:cytoskeleton protein RodZ